MNLLGLPLSASAWLAPMTALAVVAGGAAVILLRDHLRLERQMLSLRDEVERLSAALQKATRAAKTGEEAETSAFDSTRDRNPSAGRPADRLDPKASAAGIAGLAAMLLETGLNGEQAIHVRRIKALAEDLAGREDPPILAQSSDPRATKRSSRVLLAEDDEINGLYAVESLEVAGAEVEWVRNGRQALDAIEASFAAGRPSYDLVLMDIRMPHMNGLEATRRIRELEMLQRRRDPLRIVALTATAMRQDKMAAEEAGFSGFLSKPYRADALSRLLAPPVRLAKAS
ncbi:MAG TPA: response regulator [Microvirga sp.]|jgi:CheY-like chemotaxis protein|nr:response regulator [Microvirga sp.]